MRNRAVGMSVVLVAATCLAAAAGDEVIVRPEVAPGPLDNPLKGWCPYTNARPISQPYSMVFLYAPWRDLEPEEGRYAFDRWEAKDWAVPAAAGKHVVFRIYVDYPRKPSGLPGWLKDQRVKLTPYTDHGGGLAPDYDDPRMIQALERLIAALGQRYDADPRVGFVELGLLGFWGEWHTWPLAQLYASQATERRVIEAYRRAFPHKQLLARSARDGAGEQPWVGFHDDMFPEDTDNGHDWSFLAGFRRSGRLDNWKQAAIGGEMVPNQAKSWLEEGYEETFEMVKRSHISWVGPYCPALEDSNLPRFRGRSEALVRRMGYQFQLDEVRYPAVITAGGKLAVAIRGANTGVAPFYYPWPVTLALIDEAGQIAGRFPLGDDIRTWLPGAFTIQGEVQPGVKPGNYRIALGIVDPGTDRPTIRFANKLDVKAGWTVLGAVTITPASGQSEPRP